MNRDDIIRMAREAGFIAAQWHDHIAWHGSGSALPEKLEQFARLVAAAEREACAKVADENDGDMPGEDSSCVWSKCARHIADEIRKRGAL